MQRVASGGFSRWEGSIGGTPPYPYPISYRSIVPRSSECQNVFCTFALSASHVAFASCRMEPVFMMTSQSAGTAAAFAIDDNVPVQQVSYPKLSAQLRADGQLLTWATAAVSTNGIILDQGGPGTASSGGWTAGANAGGWNGDYWHDGSHRQRDEVGELHADAADERHLRGLCMVGRVLEPRHQHAL